MNDDTPDISIADRRAHILERIDKASKTKPSKLKGRDVTLVAVSKVQPDVRIAAMLAAGQTVFGENRVQEAQSHWRDSFGDHRKGLTLHLIGPLQTNKAEDACAMFDVIETLDRVKLARHIASAAQKIGRMPELYVQVNTGAEPQKAGVLPEELDGFIKTLRKDYDITPSGLMCIPPISEAPSPHFILLRQLAARNGITKLSMGMSGDFETAVKLGATHVRIGSALFGERDYGEA